MGVATGINSMLDRGALKWKLSVSVHVDGFLSSRMDWMGVDAGSAAC